MQCLTVSTVLAVLPSRDPNHSLQPQPQPQEEEYEASSEGMEEEEYWEDDLPNALLRILVTEEGESIADVLKGIQVSLSQQSKVMYKLTQIMERYAKRA